MRWSRRAEQVLLGLAATIMLAALLAGIPYGLTRGIGWPLPHHLPTLHEIKTTLTGTFTDRLLLDTLACLCWLVWAMFVADTIRSLPEAMHSARGPGMPSRWQSVVRGDARHSGPLRGLAAVLLATIVTGLLSLRFRPAVLAGAGTTAAAARPTVVTTSAQVGVNRATGTHTVIVQAPRDGIHDSLWRIAARCLGDGARWPEIFRLNHALPQPGGDALTRPSLIQPGWVLRLPTTTPPEGSGGSRIPAPPSVTRPRAPDTRTPPEAPTTATPTTRTPRSSPAPSSSTPASPAASSPPRSSPPLSPQSVGRPVVHGSGRSGAVDLGDGALVGLGLAGAISTALLVARRRRRRFYVPGSGRRDDLLPVAPVVRTLHLAHLRATAETAKLTEEDADAHSDTEAHVDVAADRANSDGPGDAALRGADGEVQAADSRRSASRGPEVHGVASGSAAANVSAGVADGQEVALDLAGLGGVGLVGPGAAGAARALILHLFATAGSASGGPKGAGQAVLVPADTARALQLPKSGRCPARLHLVADLEGCLDAAETQMLRRARLATSATSTASARWAVAGLALVVVCAVPADTRRLQAILDAGAEAGVGAILLGQWRPGISLYVAADGTVTATSPGPGEPLRGARLFHLSALDAAVMFDQLHAADPPSTQPATGSDRVRVAGVDQQHWSAEKARPDMSGLPEPNLVISPPVRSAPTHQPRAHSRNGLLAARREESDGIERATLTLTVFGPVRLTWAPPDPHPSPAGEAAATTADITTALSPRLRELLVLLALHPDGISRDRLADMLWPETSAERPFATLNTNLARLRRTIVAATRGQVSEIVLTVGDRHQLNPDIVYTDFRIFSDALAARRAATSDEQRASAYRQAVAAYRGELGEGLSAEWLETSREAVRRDAVDAASSLARLLAGSDPRGALEMLETARAFDPYNEAIYRDIMRLQRRLGQPDAIERTLALLTTRLTDLEEAPAPETLALAQRLRSPHSEPTPPVR